MHAVAVLAALSLAGRATVPLPLRRQPAQHLLDGNVPALQRAEYVLQARDVERLHAVPVAEAVAEGEGGFGAVEVVGVEEVGGYLWGWWGWRGGGGGGGRG